MQDRAIRDIHNLSEQIEDFRAGTTPKKAFFARYKRLHSAYKWLTFLTTLIGVSMITLALIPVHLLAHSWFVWALPITPVLLLGGFFLTILALGLHWLHITLQSTLKEELGEQWRTLGKRRGKAAVLITLGILLAFLPIAAPFLGHAITAFFDNYIVMTASILVGISTVALTTIWHTALLSFEKNPDGSLLRWNGSLVRSSLIDVIESQMGRTGNTARRIAIFFGIFLPFCLIFTPFVGFASARFGYFLLNATVSGMSILTLWITSIFTLIAASFMGFLGYVLLQKSGMEEPIARMRDATPAPAPTPLSSGEIFSGPGHTLSDWKPVAGATQMQEPASSNTTGAGAEAAMLTTAAPISADVPQNVAGNSPAFTSNLARETAAQRMRTTPANTPHAPPQTRGRFVGDTVSPRPVNSTRREIATLHNTPAPPDPRLANMITLRDETGELLTYLQSL